MKQLFVELSEGIFIELDLKEDIPIPIDKSIYDFKDINKKKQDISKTITLPATKANNRYFQSFIEYGSVQNENEDKYNVNQEVVAKLLSNSGKILKGSLELIDVITKNGVKGYKVRIFGGVVDIFERAKNLDIKELGWSEYTHNLTRANIKDSWTNTSGYVYGLIERRERVGATIWKTQDLVPYVFLYELAQKFFDFLGINYNFPLLDEARFRKILFGFGGGDIITLSAQALNDRLIDYDDLVFSSEYETMNYFSSLNFTFPTYPILFSSKTNGYQLDIAKTITQDNISQATSYGAKVVYAGSYELNGVINFNYFLEKGDGVTPTTLPKVRQIAKLELRVLVNMQPKKIITYTLPFDSTQEDDVSYNYAVGFVIDELVLELEAGDEISFSVLCPAVTIESNQDDEYQLRTRVETQVGDEGNLELTSLAKETSDNEPVLIPKYLPSMTGDEFLKNLITTFNLLYFEDNNGVLNFYTYNEFYDRTNPVKWTDKIDRKKPIKLEPLSSSIEKEIKNEWGKKDEVDAKFYEDRREEPYGDNVYTNPNNLAKGNKSFKTTWANIVPWFDGDQLIYPRFTDDSGKGKKGVARIMMYNGLKDGFFTLRNTNDTTSEVVAQYPLVHTFDDIDNPTFDLNFSLPKEVYYLTNKVVQVNLFSEYYEKYIREITDADARMLEASFYLHEQDVRNIDFRKLYEIDNKLFKLNMIKSFDADATSSTKCELVKLLELDYIDPVVIELDYEPLPPSKEDDITIGSNDDEVDSGDQSVKLIDGGEQTNEKSVNLKG